MMHTCSNCGYCFDDELDKDRNPLLYRCPICNTLEPSPELNQTDQSEPIILMSPAEPSNHPSSTSSRREHPSLSRIEPLSEEADTIVYTDIQPTIQEVAVSNPKGQNEFKEKHEKDVLPTQEERVEATRQSLREKGFILNEDARGLRLSGISTRGNKPMSDLSPYDIIRLAADLEGGLLPPEERKRCPKCDAVIAPGGQRCQWCSEPL